MSSALEFSPGFQTHHFKTTNVPGTLVTVVPIASMPKPDGEDLEEWTQDFLALVAKDMGGTYELSESFRVGSYGGTNVVIHVKKVSDE
ncbi:hypothetical protein LCGC14_0276120 [marine sediment metagenome]|uniref:Uncharacterized protein n=1 Tax=marine sediment metagenome TaxID=412755 RepID=A0A0F9TXS3_9ZZZZ